MDDKKQLKIREMTNEERGIWESIERHAWIPWVSMKEVAEKKEQPVIKRGEGVFLEDIHGKRYLDASSGPVAVNYGYGTSKIVDAVKEQLDNLHFLHYRIAFTDKVADLVKKIADLTPGTLNRIHLNVTGTDAVEGALKIARSYFPNPSKNKVVSLYGGYHGLSYGTLSVSGFAFFKEPFARNTPPGTLQIHPPYCYRCAYGLEHPGCGMMCARMLDETVKAEGPGSVAAFIAEPIMGVAGVITPPDEYWPLVRNICDRHNILLIADEVMTGWGRTGRLFTCQYWDVEPDMLTMAKGLSGVYQGISAVAIKDKIFERFADEKFFHSHTQSSSPISAAAAIAAIEMIEERDLVKRAATMGGYLRKKLEKLMAESPLVGEIRGKGLFQAAELVADRASKKRLSEAVPNFSDVLHAKFQERGVIIRLGGYNSDTLYFSPPLIVEESEIDTMVDVTREVLGEIHSAL